MRQYERAEETYVAAASLLKGLAAEFPNEPDYHMDLARTYDGQADLLWKAGRLKEAEQVYRKALFSYGNAIKLDPSNSAHWHMRGETYWKTKQLDEALADLSQAISLNPRESWHWGIRGQVYADMERWDKAIADKSKAIEVNPSNSEYWRWRGDTYSEMKQWDKAISDYSKAIELNPSNSGHWHWRGETYWKTKQWDKALADLSQAISLNPHESWHWGIRGSIYTNMERWDKAIADKSKAIELASTDGAGRESRRRLPEMYRSLGDVLEKMGRLDEAQEAYQKAHEVEEEVVTEETEYGGQKTDDSNE
jgi:tetratricopeptide (TPR) repeat protein